ncbi:unnamed protein product [Rotaria sp. Silwood2]|nr:unnamed protein product [Rotaria sp. Silwood2]CAF2924094.1 unnamed protein product [Rotaria sp. Silwood2]CAF3051766.1 unnamed protein product [Rotaria sp. Silwood2]CAF3915225.1 unnamed protein product [Rotaria sp. Silwood2]CAF4040879.1 unnamed protein product [Rotaria sp. Silwood2]
MPECSYTMTSRGKCELCRTPIDIKYRKQASVLFNHYVKYRFIHGYESILNCPVTISTKNLFMLQHVYAVNSIILVELYKH